MAVSFFPEWLKLYWLRPFQRSAGWDVFT